jgi:hypothetical protein
MEGLWHKASRKFVVFPAMQPDDIFYAIMFFHFQPDLTWHDNLLQCFSYYRALEVQQTKEAHNLFMNKGYIYHLFGK